MHPETRNLLIAVILIIVVVVVGFAFYRHGIPSTPILANKYVIVSAADGRYLQYRSGIFRLVKNKLDADVITLNNESKIVDQKTGNLLNATGGKTDISSKLPKSLPWTTVIVRNTSQGTKLLATGTLYALAGNTSDAPAMYGVDATKDNIWKLVQV